ncbi:hypothetical protein VP249E411_P0195 [Vibrio phage 249E41-1]|nr:hypothetical protein VP249E411_P0195 [Vibrio phage 249E41-1]CAH9017373.1 hypothetical protein VP193E371_P0198 [Vibrio phage 193E37-1]
MKFNKGDKIGAVFEGSVKFIFTCRNDNSCKKVLQRYVVLALGKPNLKYMFVPQ